MNIGIMTDHTMSHIQISEWKMKGLTIVFTNGVFDILHAGHVDYLKKARETGDRLIVGINSDESVRLIKGKKRPINPLADRLQVLEAVRWVDLIIPFTGRTAEALVRHLEPDIYVKGGDYHTKDIPEARIVREYGGAVSIIPFRKNRSTTDIINTIIGVYCHD